MFAQRCFVTDAWIVHAPHLVRLTQRCEKFVTLCYAGMFDPYGFDSYAGYDDYYGYDDYGGYDYGGYGGDMGYGMAPPRPMGFGRARAMGAGAVRIHFYYYAELRNQINLWMS